MAVLHSLLLFALLKQCPSPEDIQPCSCSEKNPHIGPEISCVGVASEESLKKALGSLEQHELPKLRIAGATFSTLKEDLFQRLAVRDLVLDRVEVEDASFSPGRKHFEGLEASLQSLEVSKSFKKHQPLSNLKLDHVTHLSVAIFEDNNIPEVGDDWFAEGPAELSVLIFERNGIEVLGKSAFRALTGLKLLTVAGNHLREISRSMLPETATRLATLDLAYNKLRELPLDMFKDFPSLQVVNFSFNLLHILQEDIWSAILPNVNRIHLEGNPLDCDKMRWMCGTSLIGISGNCVMPAANQGQTLTQFCRETKNYHI